MERICPLCCEGIGDVCHYLTQCNKEEIKKVRHELMMPFYQNWRGIEKLSNEEPCRAILLSQNEDLLVEIGILCLKRYIISYLMFYLLDIFARFLFRKIELENFKGM